MCALDASKGNRVKENYHLDVDYASIYGINEINIIRKLVALEIAIINSLDSLGEKQKASYKDEMENLLTMSDVELHKKRVNCSIKLRNLIKPNYELNSYNIADDKSIIMNYQNNNTNRSENMLIQFKEYDNIENYIRFLMDKLVELQEAKKADKNGYRKKLELLSQVTKKESTSKI